MSGAPSIAGALLLLTTATLGGCDPAPAPPPPLEARADKERIYGDALLVPSRNGERAREEIAAAGEIERLLAEDPTLSAIRVHVRSASAEGPAQIVVVARARAGEALDRARCERIAREVVGDPSARVDVDEVVGAAALRDEPAPRDLARDLALAFALLALGASAGITVDRVRRAGRRR